MNSDRGMMKWMPYQSLVEQASFLAVMRRQKARISKPRISSERAEKINEILTTYCGEEVKVKYYDDGFLHFLDGTISKIDATWRYILLQGKRIDFRNLIDLERR